MRRIRIPLIPVITGTIALIAIIVTIVIVAGNGGEKGLFITETTDGVSIASADGTEVGAASGTQLNQGDTVSTGEGAYCVIAYKGKKNSENNYIILNEGSELVITDKFGGKTTGQLLLNNGSVLCNLAEDSKGGVNIRTADTLVYTDNSVAKIAYTTDGFSAYTDVYTFMGKNKIQLYDTAGNTVNDPEPLIEKRKGQVTTNDLGPEFTYLNIDFSLDELTAADLKNLLTIAAFIEDFPYTNEELSAAYGSAPTEDMLPLETESSETTAAPSESGDNSDIIQTAEPIETNTQTETSIDIKPPAITTAAPQTTTSSEATTTTAAPTPTTEATSADKNRIFTVTVIIDDEESIQEVAYGESAEIPETPYVEGKTFVGWDNSFDDITEDRVITALFEGEELPNDETSGVYHNVTLVVADKSTILRVKDGDPAPIPESIAIDGYMFYGWDTDYSCIKSDITVTAILKGIGIHTVTFMISGQVYTVQVENGGTALPPFVPTNDINGDTFTGWDKSLNNITADTTITAVFGASSYTVTFVIDGKSYPVMVKNGEDAIPPFTPTVNSQGQTFIGWSGNYLCVKSDLTITAIFA